MVSCVRLDEKIANVFSPLYQGDIMEYTKEGRFGFGGVRDGEPIGLFLASFYNDMATVDWVYVSEDARGQGIGRHLIDGGVRLLRDLFGEDIISVCCEDEKLKDFLTKEGFRFEEETDLCTYRGKLSSLVPLPEFSVTEGGAYRLSELKPSEYNALTLYFESLEDTEVPVELPIRKEDYLDVPAVFIRDDMIRSVLLLKKEAGEEVSIAFAYAFNHDGMALSCLISEARKAVEKLYGEDVTISTTSLGLHTERMMDKLFDGIEKKPVYYGIYYGE